MSAAALWISVLQSYGSLKLEALKARLGLSEFSRLKPSPKPSISASGHDAIHVI
jgi:hypothetical protein